MCLCGNCVVDRLSNNGGKGVHINSNEIADGQCEHIATTFRDNTFVLLLKVSSNVGTQNINYVQTNIWILRCETSLQCSLIFVVCAPSAMQFNPEELEPFDRIAAYEAFVSTSTVN